MEPLTCFFGSLVSFLVDVNQCESENNSFSIDVDHLQEKIVDRLKFGRLWHGEERPIHILYIYINIMVITWVSKPNCHSSPSRSLSAGFLPRSFKFDGLFKF